MAKCFAIHFSWAVLLLLVVASIASADTITLSTPDPAGGLSGFTGPYATVTVNLIDPTQASVTFTSDTTAGTSFLMGGTSAANLNLNPSSTVGGSIVFATVSPGLGFNAVPFVMTYGTLNQPVGGFGSFNFQINLRGEYTDAAFEIAFTLNNTSGTWATAADVLTPNANGNLAAINGFACANPGTQCDATVPALGVGFASDGPPAPPIPEPAGMTLLGMFLLAGWRALPRKG